MEYTDSIGLVFERIDQNGSTAKVDPRFVRIEIIETVAVGHLKVRQWTGRLAGANTRDSNVFTLLNRDDQWKITHKLFHWHEGS